MSVTEEICPNCGAPLSLVGGRCEYCEAPLLVGASAAVTTDGAAAASRPEPPASFSMPVSQVDSVPARGTRVSGVVATGSVRSGMHLILTHKGENTLVTCVEVDAGSPSGAGVGQTVGLWLDRPTGDHLDHKHVRKGDWLHEPGVAAPG